ncbi:Eaf3p [Saccharomyces cerevisiae S288C]|uniref:Chromatin modification-related protein EAF3 n=8 Tax=Saccharomyces cerevisiae TaxID=4932 RepID=EAF3_YEAST|nr:Eaf3p [Saccharomyces cerevisiae S288C]Q12432.1 RecName: Full=Chromatin modification-related protein EAF3; AltName: Full=ESA1-associated factor 3 [Saccharomyces cerevisiae S288C]7YI0_C Chain C, Chromatin modification-related protein EAF3 [Saccharomyces cerevisiae S288C]7YI0_E Chain E, Chromatin modification-related protein EAF3 [Saccharomyces cerevisiae S288C]7YI1_K Chain K, Chromatin modification-related protein EAF3 [Saccharomyces cerevisiae S288C]7YI1_L Chain L, Chromatin modification-rel|eukprot:NP_015348.1 Eaf3p [Saccharomyces cerevisiae S288C]
MVDLEQEFALGGRCLAFHGPLMYEAKILKIWDPSSKMYTSIPNDKPGGSSQATKEIKPQKLGEDESIPEEIINGKCFFIHYQGWKSSWDEWVGYDRIRAYNEENIAMKKRLANEAKEAKKSLLEQQKKKKLSTSLGGPSNGGKRKGDSRSNASISKSTSQSFLTSSVSGRKSGRSSANSLHPGSSLRSSSDQNGNDDRRRSSSLSPNMLHHIAGYPTPKISLQIPIKLKSVLVDDWEYVTKDKKICRLPADVTVEMVLNKYEHEVSQELESPGSQSQLSEYCAGLKLYFDKCLGNMLLYRLERLQYDELLKKSSKDQKPLVPIRIYGAIHLLRLISVLPELISSTTMDLQSCQLLIKQTEDFLVWLLMHVDEYFNDKDPNRSDDALYVNTSSQYEGVALGM